MPVRFQLSDKRGDAIILVTADADTAEEAEIAFAEAVGYAGLARQYDAFANGGTGPAVATVVQHMPGAQVAPPQDHGPAIPAAAIPSCQHGQKVWKTGTSARGEWKAWACPAQSSDPTRCKFQFVRD